jgi:adenosine deaminase
LHLHLEGSARPTTIIELANKRGVSLDRFWAFENIDDFYERYLVIDGLISQPDDLRRICYEIIEDEAAAGVRYSQPGISPQLYSPRFGRIDDVFDIMVDGFRQASQATGVSVGYLVEVDLARSVEQVELIANFAATHASEGVAAFGLATFNPNPDFRRFARACDIAREAGLQIVPHAGEHDPPQNIRDALDYLKADRIAHGIRAIEDADLLCRLAIEAVPCDVCPTSNVLLHAVPTLEMVPLRTMLQAGVRFTINSDDQLFFKSNVAQEYSVVREAFGFSDETVAQIATTAIEVSGAPSEIVVQTKHDIDAWLESLP